MPLPDYGETLRPDFRRARAGTARGSVRRGSSSCGSSNPARTSTASSAATASSRPRLTAAWSGSCARPACRRVSSSTAARCALISAPRGESSGWLDFRVADMVQTAGRPISTALRLLLGQPRLLSLPRAQRLTALLEDSRKFQNEVSERLAEQVLHALYELLRGFQAAHDASKGELLREPLAEHPDEVYRALLTVILRLVFLLYAEERDMLPEDETFLRYYSLAGLYERLREDAALFPDTMDQRYGAWAQLLVLFPHGPRRRRVGRDAAAQAPLASCSTPTALRSSRGRPWRRASDPRAHRAAARAGRHHLPRAREAARPRRRAHLLPRARRGADRLGLRDDDGLPPRDGDRPLGGDQGPEEAGRADGGRPRGAACGARGQAREVAPGPRRSQATDSRCQEGREGRRDA